MVEKIFSVVLAAAVVCGGVKTIQGQTKGSVVVAGVIRDRHSAEPLGEVAVVLSSKTGRSAMRVVTADDGRFRFDNPAPDEYTIFATKTDYEPGGYGQRFSGEEGGWFKVEANSPAGLFSSLVIQLTKFGSISGTLRVNGVAPALSSTIKALRKTWENGREVYKVTQTAVPNLQGAFRLPRLVPGQYLVAASVVGRQTVFSPGQFQQQAASVIELGEGADIEAIGIDVPGKVPGARVSGVVSGGRSGTAVQLVALSAAEPAAQIEFMTTNLDRNLAFAFDPVPPGRYFVRAVQYDGQSQSSVLQDAQWAVAQINVEDSDLIGLELRMAPGFEVKGRVTLKSQKTEGSNPAPRRISVGVVPVAPTDMNAKMSVVGIGDTGEFITPRLLPGTYAVGALIAANSWFVQSVSVDGKDVTGGSFQLTSDQDHVEITVTDQPSSLGGIVRDSDGKATNNAAVLIFPRDSNRWNFRYVFEARPNLFAQIRPDSGGTYSIRILPPGDYLAIAVDGEVTPNWQNENIIKKLAPLASPVSLSVGMNATANLTLKSLSIK